MSTPNSRSGILSFYAGRIQDLKNSIGEERKRKTGLAAARLAVVMITTALVYFFWPSLPAAILFCVAGGILLTILVFIDAGKTERIKNQERLIQINEHEIAALEKDLSVYEDGNRFSNAAHAYAGDLDLFGPASLYQYLSRCHADQSKRLLAQKLLTPLPLPAIPVVQAAVREMSGKTEWSQQFQAKAMAAPLRVDTEERLNRWLNDPELRFRGPFWTISIALYTLISLTVLVLYLFDRISFPVFLAALLAFIAIAFAFSSKVQPAWVLLSRIEPEMDVLHEQLSALEKEPFQTDFPRKLKNGIRDGQGLSASSAIREFRSILRRFDFRLNLIVFFFLNTFLLWDLRQLRHLNDWKKKHRQNLRGWFSAIAETEVLISLASLARNESGWCFPEINDRYFNLSMQDAGHPLIQQDIRVNNSFRMKGTGKIAIITGSNMAGKSTFLRSLGTNLVLALMGAPVCASRFESSHLYLLSSMRVADNLAENTSTFYAELKKLQLIIQEVEQRKPVFILLDEVLRGTNSADRHSGTIALIRQLIRENAVCVIATHDTELARAESDRNPEAICNYHFDGQIEDEELSFDYRLRDGICESMNATYLMKKIGIHFDD